MNFMHENRLDLNLLRVFRALLIQQNVTKAATTLGLTQPAVSHALTRLRECYNDPLFVRIHRRMEPTQRALELGKPICEALDRIGATFNQRFDPKTIAQTFRIAFIDYGGIFFLPALLSKIGADAPNVKILSEYMENATGYARLQDPEVDLGIGMIRGNRETWRRAYLLDDPFVLIMRKNHPLRRPKLSLSELANADHVRIPLFDCFEPLLAKQGVRRNFAVTAQHFLPVPFIVARSNLLALVPRSVYLVFKDFCGIRSAGLTIELPPYTIELVYDQRKENDPAHRWLVSCITASATEVARDVMPKSEAARAAGKPSKKQ
jgi:DNA-binding transcriptional LysR family regulator